MNNKKIVDVSNIENVYTDDFISKVLSDKERKIIAILYQTSNIKYFGMAFRKNLELGNYITPSAFFNELFEHYKDELSDYEIIEIEKII